MRCEKNSLNSWQSRSLTPGFIAVDLGKRLWVNKLVVHASKERVFSGGLFLPLLFNNSRTRSRANQARPTPKIQNIGSHLPIVFSLLKKKGQHQPKWLMLACL